MLELINEIKCYHYFNYQIESIDVLYDKNNWYCKEYFETMTDDELRNLLKTIIDGRRKYLLFMTDDNYQQFITDLVLKRNDLKLINRRTFDDLYDSGKIDFNDLSKNEIINLINRYVDLNIILVDDVAAIIMRENNNPYVGMMHINYALAMRKRARGLVRVLM